MDEIVTSGLRLHQIIFRSILLGLASAPMWLLYGISDIIFLLGYYLIGYRKKVVRDNLSYAFPEKSDIERRKIEVRFYRNLADQMVESIKFLKISRLQLNKRVIVTNSEGSEFHLKNTERNVILQLSHCFNWEWAGQIFQLRNPHPGFNIAVYRTQSNSFFNHLILEARTRFGAEVLPSEHIIRRMLQTDQPGNLVLMVADQAPLPAPGNYWTEFLNRPAPFFSGIEKIAQRKNYVLTYVDVRKLRRGYYEADISIITDKADQYSGTQLTELYVRKMEACIRQHPENYLWSHRRWKHSPPDSYTSVKL